MEGRLITDRYRLVRLLGKGGMGSVWLAEHTSLKSEVAVKLIHSELGKMPQIRARFMREAQLAARIKSAHVVQVHDHGVTEDDQPYIAMEYLAGISLRDRMTERGRLTLRETSRVVSHVCRALARAHEAGLVHRDLKPENIFLASEADEEIVKVLDFGVAKAADALSDSGIDPTRTGALCGTPYYMSPEQAQGLKTVDFRTDLWAIGVVVFECLTGRQPFAASALGPLIGKILAAPIPVPSQTAPDAKLSPQIDEWMEQALSRDPAKRFGSAKELAESFSVAAGTAESAENDHSGRQLEAAATPASRRGADPTLVALAATTPLASADTLPFDTGLPRVEQAVATPAVPNPPSRTPGLIAIVVLVALVAGLGVRLWLR